MVMPSKFHKFHKSFSFNPFSEKKTLTCTPYPTEQTYSVIQNYEESGMILHNFEILRFLIILHKLNISFDRESNSLQAFY